ncbi:MAG TPA: hypothetical protein P5137_17115 [Candidatus Brocadiia bacterium]|nr:hypothetical protein [Candidatus Brocadiia bacterium]
MDKMRTFDAWAWRARQEDVPPVDVAAAVMRRVAALPEAREEDGRWVPWATAGVMACAAAVCAAMGLEAWSSFVEPLAAWARQFSAWGLL